MDSEESYHKRSQTTPQSIPLQDLNRPPEDGVPVPGASQTHRRTLSERSRDLFSRGGGSTAAAQTRYTPIQEVAAGSTPTLRVIAPEEHTLGASPYDDVSLSPNVDAAAFQSAIGPPGLSFHGDTSYGAQSASTSHAFAHMFGQNYSTVSLSESDQEFPMTEFPDFDNDRVPLTDRRSMQPMAGSNLVPSSLVAGAGRDRRSAPNVHFDTKGTMASPARLGDDLLSVEAGLDAHGRRGSRIRSLSPSTAISPIQRAGTVVRNMSQRIVNLTNEQDVVENELRRRQSQRNTKAKSELIQTGPKAGLVDGSITPTEKGVDPFVEPFAPRPTSWVKVANPLKGNSLGLFEPGNPIRTKLCDILVHPITEPAIMMLILLQTVLLAVDSSTDVYEDPRSKSWGSSWIDYALLAVFVIYTIEMFARIVVSGFIVNAVEYSTINRGTGLKDAVKAKARELFALQHTRDIPKGVSFNDPIQPSIIRAFTGHGPAGFNGSYDNRSKQRFRLAHRAFLRHSFNRLDFLAVISFWISFVLALTGMEAEKHMYVFRMLSCLRILRLLSLTSGTSVILRSLKKAAPLLLNVALLIGFFWLLFAVVGVQSFKSSLRRTCVWIDPDGLQPNYTSNSVGNFQFCGGSVAANGTDLPWYYPDGASSGVSKGYRCPPNSLCVSSDNPYNGTVSFDNIAQSLELVFVIMTSNTYTDIMYYLTDSDYLVAALYFAFGIIVLTFWLVNLLIAVITSSFQIIREESRTSAFSMAEETTDTPHGHETPRRSHLRQLYDKSSLLWVVVITYGTICQCLRSANMSDWRRKFIDASETAVTFILLAEIIFRIIVDWRNFTRKRRNWFDLGIALITAIMQIPQIHHSGQAYEWLTIFQIIRVYRVVLAVPWTRSLILMVLGNVSGLLNLILFVFLVTFLVAIFAAQLFRGELPQEDANGNPIHVTFATIYNCFLGMYQVFSSENWTTLMYNVTTYDAIYHTSWIGAMFFILWFILGFFIVLNMFIAVIQESFDVSEDAKRIEQIWAFIEQKELGGSTSGTLSLSSMFKLSKFWNKKKDPMDYGSAMTEMLLKDTVVREFLDDEHDDYKPEESTRTAGAGARHLSMIIPTGPRGWIPPWLLKVLGYHEPNPFYSRLKFSRDAENFDIRSMAREVIDANEQRKREQRDYLLKYPNYNMSLWIFKPDNPLRKLCQRAVGPGRGDKRIEGVDPNPVVWYAFSAILYAAIVAMVLLACVTTPLYQREYFDSNNYNVWNWFIFTDLAFAVIFSVEGVIRIIADGFFWTPNAYFRSSWGLIDGVVLVTLWINVVSTILHEGAVSRAVGAFKALRALRLLNVSDSARNNFHSVIVKGGWKVLSAAFVSLSLLIPFAIWGLNLFNGKMYACNDSNSDIFNLADCVDEYMSSPYNWDILAPRQVSNPWYSFDDFGSSLFILFSIVSQEGWTDVMWSAESITGFFTQPRPFASQFNAIFFVVFNLLGAVFVLTLFVSVFMRNYTEQTGVAFLTSEQRSWLELRKLLRQVSPSKRPATNKQRLTWEQWCYRRAIRKTGRWQRFVTSVLVVHLILLCLEMYPENFYWERTRDYLFLGLTLFYLANVIIRIIGLTWARFRKSSWDLFSLFAVGGTIVTTVLLLSNFQEKVYVQLHKLFLVSIALLLIPRNNQLDQLFKTAAASLPAIANLMATWFVLFLVYAIALTQTFGLTRFGENETGNINFRDVPKALILLFRTSTGEGWNQIMEDFASIKPPYCTIGDSFLNGDCGSTAWARVLFISWNILSMYIFVNMFVSLIYESFSYVYQRSSGLSIISRSEIRRFKQAWAEYDPNGTGFISKETFARFLGELSGVFDMRVHTDEFSVRTIIDECKTFRMSTMSTASSQPFEDDRSSIKIDIDKLNAKLSTLPVDDVRKRRQRLRIFYEEVMVTADQENGVAFSTLLMILAHYRVINDSKSLKLEEYLRRRARLQRVDDAVRRSLVTSFFETLYWRRRFLRHMDRKRGTMTSVPKFQVPEILVEDEDAHVDTSPQLVGQHKPTLSLQIPGASSQASGRESRHSTSTHRRSNSIQRTPTSHRGSLALHGRPSMSSTHGSVDLPRGSISSGPPSPVGSDDMNRSSDQFGRRGSNVSSPGGGVLDALDNSAWGESMRKSFSSMRKSSDRGSRS